MLAGKMLRKKSDFHGKKKKNEYHNFSLKQFLNFLFLQINKLYFHPVYLYLTVCQQ